MLQDRLHTQSSGNEILNRILEIFFSIDEKIMELHQCSSEDFLSLNSVLKENHSKAQYITQSAGVAFDKLGDNGNIQHLEQLRQKIQLLKQDFDGFEEQINQSLNTLEILESNFSLMFVPINNFRQNLTSLKLLLSNIKLTNAFRDRSLKSFTDEESNRIDAVIGKVKDSCPVFEENIFNIQKHLKSLYQDLGTLKSVVFSELHHKLDKLDLAFENLSRLSREALKNRKKVDDIARNSNQSVGSIITNLQYHDIIRQKMEHIQHTHKLIIQELNNRESASDFSGNHPFFFQIPRITEIQVAQLLHTNKEYQKAIEIISTKMIDIGSDMVSIGRICSSIGTPQSAGYDESWDVAGTTFSAFVNESERSLNKFSNITDEVVLIQKIIGELFERFQDLEMMENAIEQRIIDKISFGNLLVSDETETASQAQQILKLYAANHFEKNKIRTLFENSSQNLREFRHINTSFVREQKGLENIHGRLGESLSHFEKLEENTALVDNKRNQIVETSHEIEMAGKEVVEKVKYYDFFDKTIEEVIARFEQINDMVKGLDEKVLAADEKLRGLEQIEKYYTMKSERIIHSQTLLKGNIDMDELFNVVDNPSQREGNDVEFF